MAAHENMSHEQFFHHMVDVLGPESDQDNPNGYEWGKVPPHVFRSMSEDEYQAGMKQGYFQSDQRNNWRQQMQKESRPNWHEAPIEGTVAAVTAYTGYLPEDQPGRVVKFDTSKHEGWEVHPHVPEGDYIRTMGRIPADSIVATTKPVIRRG
jgi:hypothetical protein